MNRSAALVTYYPPIAFVKGTLISQLANHLKDVKPNEDSDWKYGDVYEVTKEFLTTDIKLWPEIEDSENGIEPQDCENFEIISIDEVGAIIATGGDWQDPIRIYITCDLTGQLTVWKAEFCDFPESGLGDNEILKIIGR